VQCNEHAPLEHHQRYPLGPIVESVASLDARAAGRADYRAALVASVAYNDEQFAWAVTDLGVSERNRIKYDAFPACLDAYRARGLIR
jgi:hypothetical protein